MSEPARLVRCPVSQVARMVSYLRDITLSGIAVVLTGWLFAASPAHAETEPVDADKPWTFTLFFENDLFGDTDQNYTSGIKLSWMSPDLLRYRDSGDVPEWFRRRLRRLLFFDDPKAPPDPLVQRNVVLSIGQSIFTPQDIDAFDLIEDDRPYAGWLYAGLAFRKRDLDVLDTLELQLGVVGPASLSEPAQVFVHEFRNLDKPNGWEHQLENEPTIGIAYERKWRTVKAEPGLGWDFIPHLGAVIGNAYTYGNVGGEIRVGWNLPPDFGDPLIRPGGVTSPPLVFDRSQKLRLYLFGFVDARAVARDITLDGNTFADSHSVDKRHLVADLAVGASLVFDRFKLTIAQALRTREFEGEKDDHRFGSISMAYSF